MLDRLISTLDAVMRKTPHDAIDAELAAPPRVTAVRALRDDPIVQQFRQELIDGLIRVDTAQRLLALIEQAVGLLGRA